MFAHEHDDSMPQVFGMDGQELEVQEGHPRVLFVYSEAVHEQHRGWRDLRGWAACSEQADTSWGIGWTVSCTIFSIRLRTLCKGKLKLLCISWLGDAVTHGG